MPFGVIGARLAIRLLWGIPCILIVAEGTIRARIAIAALIVALLLAFSQALTCEAHRVALKVVHHFVTARALDAGSFRMVRSIPYGHVAK